MENIQIAIYQAPYASLREKDISEKIYSDYHEMLTIPAEHYSPVFTGIIGMPDGIEKEGKSRATFILDEVFMIFNTDYPTGYPGRSMSPGDVVELEKKFYLRNSKGFQECIFDATKTKGNTSEIYSEKIEEAEQVLIDNDVDPDEAQIVLQALGYVLLGKELYPEDGSNVRFVSSDITLGRIAKTERVLADNGIDPDETQTVLQALGYILLDEELYPDDLAPM